MSVATLRPSADGTTTGWTRFPASGTFASKIVDDPDAHDGETSYALSPNAVSGTMFVELDDVPADFDPDAINSITIKVAHRRLNTPNMSVDSGTVNTFLTRADEVTAISTTPTAVNSPIQAGYALTSFTPSPTGTHTVAEWNGARLALVFTHTNAQTADSVNQSRITAVEVLVDYTPAEVVVTHTASGAVSAQSATISGAASRTRVHAASGAISAQSATVSAAAKRFLPHEASGAIAASSATVSGAASGPGSGAHDATGSISAGSATVSGQAKRYLPHAATGAISASAATISGVAKRYAIHDATGAVESGSATVSSSASRGGVVTHDATATLIAQNATISAEASGPASVAVDRPIPVGHINKHNRERFHSRAALALSRKQASLQRSVKSIEKKLAKTKGKPPEGILAKYWEAQNKMDELESKMFLLEFGDFKMPDFDNEDDDIQALL